MKPSPPTKHDPPSPRRPGAAARGLVAAALLAGPAGCAPHPETPRILPELRLDIADPVIDARIGGTTMRLRVDLDRRNSVELNPAAAARLALPFEPGGGALVGRIAVGERNAMAPVTIAGIATQLTISAFDRDCCAGADGAIGPDLLPYERVRFVRAAAVAGTTQRSFPLAASGEAGLSVATRTPNGEVLVGFSLGYPGTLATAAAGAILAAGYGGRFSGDGFDVAPAFGVARPARTIVLDRPAMLAGFAIAQVPVRIADFRGGHALPQAQAAAGDIVVSRRGPRAQTAWPSILIGRDRLDRCAEIVFQRAPMAITLRCAFADAPQ